MGKLAAICLSEEKGEQKHSVEQAELIKDYGIKGDAHAGEWHRQVSLLASEQIELFRKSGAYDIKHGDFGENLVVQGIDLAELSVGTELEVGETLLKITQRGKECHDRCSIFHKVGDCIMPREGLFAEVVRGGFVKKDDNVRIFTDPS